MDEMLWQSENTFFSDWEEEKKKKRDECWIMKGKENFNEGRSLYKETKKKMNGRKGKWSNDKTNKNEKVITWSLKVK